MAKRTVTIEETDVHVFTNAGEWHAWLRKHHAKNTGVWLRIGKKNSGMVTVSYDEAVETALCHGWIDAIRKAYDGLSFVQRFTPRKPRSIWSQVNRERVLALIKAGAMMPAGLAAVALGSVQISMMNFQSWSEMVFTFQPTLEVILSALGFAAAMGLLGGMLPALRAARMSPLEAMRD